MSKIVFVNLDVGSAIEQSGNQFIKIIKELNREITVFTQQTCERMFFQYLLDEKPDTLIINGNYPRIINPAYYYKLLNKELKLIFISRVFTDFMFIKDTSNIHYYYYNQRLKEFCEYCDYVFIVNSCGMRKRQFYETKMIDCCGTNNIDHFRITKDWDERKKKFLLFGSLNPHKLHHEFVDKLDIKVDAYGNIDNQPNWFREKFEKSNINYLGFLEYNEIPKMLNEYKYFLLPHNGSEPLNNSIIQAILCGCIPIVLDDYYTDINGDYWLKWCQDYYFGCDTVDEYLNKVNKLNNKDIDNGEKISHNNRFNFVREFGNPIKKICDVI